MFLHRFLADEHGIATTPVVGYVNDGTDDIFMSHAWLDVAGRKVDLTLHLTEHQGVQLPGALLVLDHVLRPGQVSHSYYFEMSPAAEVANAIIAQDPRGAFILRHKEQEHHEMALRAADPVLMADYLAKAPAEFGYAAMRAALG